MCSEATFQPLLQLYLLLPGLMCFDYANLGNEKLADFIGEVPDYQIWSITSSCLALAWSFNTYQATRMNGALDFTKNPAGRITLLLSCICQISSRLVILVTFAYICGPGNFWPMILGIVLHMLLMAMIHYFTRNDTKANEELFGKKLQVFYQCLINGISNLYLHNNIIPLESSSDKKEKKGANGPSDQEAKTEEKDEVPRDWKQIIVDGIIFTENVIIVAVAYLKSHLGFPAVFLVAVILTHTTGLLLKVSSYEQF